MREILLDKLCYLKPNIISEPLIWRWYAWPYLMQPLTAGCNILDRHIKIMDSFVKSPKFHAQAIRTAKLLGGPFLDAPEKAVDIIKELIRQTESNCETLIRLAKAYKRFDSYLKQEACGDTLQDFYTKLPSELKGLVELVYNGLDHPQTRIIEPLIYHKYYTDNGQTIALSEKNNDHREFVLSTPRLNKDDEVYLNLPFSDERLDKLFSTRYVPQRLKDILGLFELEENKKYLFENFFTNEEPRKDGARNYHGDKVRVRYFGHACVLLQTDKVSILIDPVISYEVNSNVPRYTFNDLPDKIDYVLLTHNHQDHVLLEMLIQLRHKIGKIIFPANNKGSIFDPSLKLILQKLGFKDLIELSEADTFSIIDGEIIGIPFLGEHSDLNIHSKLAHYVNLKGRKFLMAADSNNLDNYLYEHVFSMLDKIDILFIGMECEGAPLSWLYGPLLSKPIDSAFNKRRGLAGSNFEKAWELTKLSGCKQAFIYAMGQEPWLRYLMAIEYTQDSPQIVESNKLIAACLNKGIQSERLFGKKEMEI